MEIEIKNNMYWYLEDNKNKKKWIFDKEDDAIKKIKELIGKKIETEKLNLQVMECGSENLQLKPVSWQKIASALIK